MLFSKGAGIRGGSSKDTNRVQQKSANRHSSTSDSVLPTNELIELKNILTTMKQSSLLFLKTLFDSPSYNEQLRIKRLHAGLGDLLDSLKRIIEKYPILATPEVYASVHMLVSYIQSCHNEKISLKEVERLVNQLALYFTKSVSHFVVQLKESSEKNTKNDDNLGYREPTSSNSIFGIELEKHLTANKIDLPFVVTKCIKEVEENGIFVKGIYRVSAVKSKVNQLCEAFEKYGSKVSLTDINPNIVANVLKFYLRELPQPLFTFELYPEFIRVAKLFAVDSSEDNKERCLQELRAVLIKLPKCYYAVVTAVMQHLHRISVESEINNMSAYNLAVIFGPTLLHCLKGSSNTTSRAALFDNVHQIRAIELMITWADDLFQSD